MQGDPALPDWRWAPAAPAASARNADGYRDDAARAAAEVLPSSILLLSWEESWYLPPRRGA